MKLDYKTRHRYKFLSGGILLILLCLLIFFTTVKGRIRQAIENMTERETRIENFEIAWSLDPHFSMGLMTLGGVDVNGSRGEFVRADGVEGSLSLASLFADQITFHQLNLRKLVLDSNFSSLTSNSNTDAEIPFLSTPIPFFKKASIQSFSVSSRDTHGGISKLLTDHQVFIEEKAGADGETHEFSSTGYWGQNTLVLSGAIKLDRYAVSASNLSMSIDEQPLTVALKTDFSITKPFIDILLRGTAFDFDKSLAIIDKKTSVTKSPKKNLRAFSDAILPLLWLRDADINFQSRIDRVSINKMVFQNLIQYATLEAGFLKSKLTATGLHGGVLAIESHVDFRTGLRARFESSATLREYPLHYLPSVYALGLKEGGELDFRIDINATGRSMSELSANSEGDLQAIVRKGVMRDRWIDNVGGDVAKALKHWVAGAGKSKNVFNCLAANLSVEGGKIDVDKNIIFNTPSVTIVAAGALDLSSEKVRLSVVPMARNGTGLNVGSYINVVQLGGTLSNIRPTLNPVGTLKAGGSVWLATATAGVSLLAEGYLKRRFRKDISCDDVIPPNVFPALD